MTRTEIAAMCLQGLLACPSTDDVPCENLVPIVLKLADALLAETKSELSNATQDCEDCDQLIDERDHAEAWADKLSDAIAERFGFDIGEHSSANCPWDNALDVVTDHYFPIEVTDEMVETYCNAVAEHLGAMTEDEWRRDQADPVGHVHRVAKVGLTAVLEASND